MLVVLGCAGRRPPLTRESRNAREQAALQLVAQGGDALRVCSQSELRASSAALPRPTIPATFSVPGRKPRW